MSSREPFELAQPFTAEEVTGLADSVRGRRRAALLAYAATLRQQAEAKAGVTDEAVLERAVRAHDREDAAQKGEPDPWADGFPEPYRNERLTAMRCAFEAVWPQAALAQSTQSEAVGDCYTDSNGRKWYSEPHAERARVPEGWKLVPVEPTEDMLDAFQEGQCAWGNITRCDDAASAAIYKSMLAAAPQPVERARVPDGHVLVPKLFVDKVQAACRAGTHPLATVQLIEEALEALAVAPSQPAEGE